MSFLRSFLHTFLENWKSIYWDNGFLHNIKFVLCFYKRNLTYFP